jgi:adenylate kinase
MSSNDLKTVFFVGRPGSGKGTQAKLLAQHLGWRIFSSGDHFKHLIAHSELLGGRIKADYDRGQLSPDWLADYFFEEAVFNASLDSGVVSEGFPRSLPQAELADEILRWLGRSYRVVHLVVSEDSALARQLNRAKTEHRPDSDAVEKVKSRFDVFRTHTEPLLGFFKKHGVLVEIDGEKTPEEIAMDVRNALDINDYQR